MNENYTTRNVCFLILCTLHCKCCSLSPSLSAKAVTQALQAIEQPPPMAAGWVGSIPVLLLLWGNTFPIFPLLKVIGDLSQNVWVFGILLQLHSTAWFWLCIPQWCLEASGGVAQIFRCLSPCKKAVEVHKPVRHWWLWSPCHYSRLARCIHRNVRFHPLNLVLIDFC